MAKSQETFLKREREKQRIRKRQDKREKMIERKQSKGKGRNLEDMMAYVDENGSLTDKPSDQRKKTIYRQEDMMISIPKMEDRPSDQLRNGIVTFFNHDKGFGFITDTVSQEKIFVHHSVVAFDIRENDKVAFTAVKSFKGLVIAEVNKL